MRDVRLMIDSKPNWYWRICWMFISPAIVLVLLILLIINNKPYSMNDYVYPIYIQVLGQLVAILPIVAIVLWFTFKYCYDGGWLVSCGWSNPVSARNSTITCIFHCPTAASRVR